LTAIALLRIRGFMPPEPVQYLEAHMPPDHLKYIQWNGERFISWAEKVGPNTTSVIRLFLNRYAVEQQGYNPVWHY